MPDQQQKLDFIMSAESEEQNQYFQSLVDIDPQVACDNNSIPQIITSKNENTYITTSSPNLVQSSRFSQGGLPRDFPRSTASTSFLTREGHDLRQKQQPQDKYLICACFLRFVWTNPNYHQFTLHMFILQCVFKKRFTPLAGFGVGLPLSQLYATFLGGKLTIVPMPCYGTSAYLTLPRDGAEVFDDKSDWSW